MKFNFQNFIFTVCLSFILQATSIYNVQLEGLHSTQLDEGFHVVDDLQFGNEYIMDKTGHPFKDYNQFKSSIDDFEEPPNIWIRVFNKGSIVISHVQKILKNILISLLEATAKHQRITPKHNIHQFVKFVQKLNSFIIGGTYQLIIESEFSFKDVLALILLVAIVKRWQTSLTLENERTKSLADMKLVKLKNDIDQQGEHHKYANVALQKIKKQTIKSYQYSFNKLRALEKSLLEFNEKRSLLPPPVYLVPDQNTSRDSFSQTDIQVQIRETYTQTNEINLNETQVFDEVNRASTNDVGLQVNFDINQPTEFTIYNYEKREIFTPTGEINLNDFETKLLENTGTQTYNGLKRTSANNVGLQVNFDINQPTEFPIYNSNNENEKLSLSTDFSSCTDSSSNKSSVYTNNKELRRVLSDTKLRDEIDEIQKLARDEIKMLKELMPKCYTNKIIRDQVNEKLSFHRMFISDINKLAWRVPFVKSRYLKKMRLINQFFPTLATIIESQEPFTTISTCSLQIDLPKVLPVTYLPTDTKKCKTNTNSAKLNSSTIQSKYTADDNTKATNNMLADLINSTFNETFQTLHEIPNTKAIKHDVLDNAFRSLFIRDIKKLALKSSFVKSKYPKLKQQNNHLYNTLPTIVECQEPFTTMTANNLQIDLPKALPVTYLPAYRKNDQAILNSCKVNSTTTQRKYTADDISKATNNILLDLLNSAFNTTNTVKATKLTENSYDSKTVMNISDSQLQKMFTTTTIKQDVLDNTFHTQFINDINKLGWKSSFVKSKYPKLKRQNNQIYNTLPTIIECQEPFTTMAANNLQIDLPKALPVIYIPAYPKNDQAIINSCKVNSTTAARKYTADDVSKATNNILSDLLNSAFNTTKTVKATKLTEKSYDSKTVMNISDRQLHKMFTTTAIKQDLLDNTFHTQFISDINKLGWKSSFVKSKYPKLKRQNNQIYSTLPTIIECQEPFISMSANNLQINLQKALPVTYLAAYTKNDQAILNSCKVNSTTVQRKYTADDISKATNNFLSDLLNSQFNATKCYHKTVKATKLTEKSYDSKTVMNIADSQLHKMFTTTAIKQDLLDNTFHTQFISDINKLGWKSSFVKSKYPKLKRQNNPLYNTLPTVIECQEPFISMSANNLQIDLLKSLPVTNLPAYRKNDQAILNSCKVNSTTVQRKYTADDISKATNNMLLDLLNSAFNTTKTVKATKLTEKSYESKTVMNITDELQHEVFTTTAIKHDVLDNTFHIKFISDINKLAWKMPFVKSKYPKIKRQNNQLYNTLPTIIECQEPYTTISANKLQIELAEALPITYLHTDAYDLVDSTKVNSTNVQKKYTEDDMTKVTNNILSDLVNSKFNETKKDFKTITTIKELKATTTTKKISIDKIDMNLTDGLRRRMVNTSNIKQNLPIKELDLFIPSNKAAKDIAPVFLPPIKAAKDVTPVFLPPIKAAKNITSVSLPPIKAANDITSLFLPTVKAAKEITSVFLPSSKAVKDISAITDKLFLDFMITPYLNKTMNKKRNTKSL